MSTALEQISVSEKDRIEDAIIVRLIREVRETKCHSRQPVIHEDPQLNLPDQQNIKELWADFLKCIKDRSRPVCDIEIGHRSTNMSLLGMLSMKIGRSVKWDGRKEIILNDPEASKHLKRKYRKPWKYPES